MIVVPGMTFTVEPMLTTGGASFSTAGDGWTERIDDDMPSAQFEHTVLVTDDGVEILTVERRGPQRVRDARRSGRRLGDHLSSERCRVFSRGSRW